MARMLLCLCAVSATISTPCWAQPEPTNPPFPPITALTQQALELAQQNPDLREPFTLRSYSGWKQAGDLALGTGLSLATLFGGFGALDQIWRTVPMYGLRTPTGILHVAVAPVVMVAMVAGAWWAGKIFQNYWKRRGEDRRRRNGVSQFINQLLSPMSDEDRAFYRGEFGNDGQMFERIREEIGQEILDSP